MKAREKIEAAFSPAGSSETGVVLCYEGIYYRDHWDQLTTCPWWYALSGDIEHQLAWRRECITATPQDWFRLPMAATRLEREAVTIEERSDGVYRVDARTGDIERLQRPLKSGWDAAGRMSPPPPVKPAGTPQEVDREVPLRKEFDAQEFAESGRADLAARMREEFSDLYPLVHATSPLWCTNRLWGFEDMMTTTALNPELVAYAGERYLANGIQQVREAAALGGRAVWIEECLTDYISPKAFAELNIPLLRALIEEIHRCGMKSIYYYCGNPADRWDELFEVGADVLALEEAKKGWQVDIEDVVARAAGRTAVLGNLDALVLLEQGPASAIKREIQRQIDAGRANDGRFVMSIGSPVTPDTPVEHVRLYCDMTHELGS